MSFFQAFRSSCVSPDLEGKDGLLAPKNWAAKTPFFAEITDNGGTNIVVLDADGSRADREAELRAFRDSTGVQFDYFPFPDDTRPGELEDALFDAVPTKN